jgi:hypothetical protein
MAARSETKTKRQWPAPRIAYQMTAALAEGDTESAGQLWRELDDRGRADVLLALGAQTRNALVTIWQTAREPVAVDLPPLGANDCGTLTAALGLIFPGTGPAAAGACCPGILLPALFQVRLAAARAAGMTGHALALSCREIIAARGAA